MKVLITPYQPSNVAQWLELCEFDGNVMQHPLYDDINKQYHYFPNYIEIYEGETLVAGLKFYTYVSTKFKMITSFLSKRISVVGESMFRSDETIVQYQQMLNEALYDFINKDGIVDMVASGYFGNTEKLFSIKQMSPTKEYFFNTANINLSLPEETLWDNLHSKHRNVIRKAEKEGVEFIESSDFSLFKQLLKETYSVQGYENYNTNFSELLYKTYHAKGLARIYLAKHGEEYLSGALVVYCGKKAYYAFGGNKHNSLGAGNFLQWRIFLELKSQGLEVYCLGQVATEKDEESKKFSVGISTFKTRFGTYEIPSAKRIYIFHPWRNKLFKWLVGLKN